jgi:hypothetical protein
MRMRTTDAALAQPIPSACHAGPDCVALLAAVGALWQKPRAQHFGPFLAAWMGTRLDGLSLQQLSTSLAAVAALQLTRLDTQVGGRDRAARVCVC